jgi:hypothetical protein
MGWQDDPIVAGKPRWESDPIVRVVSPEITKPMIDLRPGSEMPTLISPSLNPYSSGRYPNRRIYTVGDEISLRFSDMLTGVEKRTNHWHVTQANSEEDRVELNNGRMVIDWLGNTVKSQTTAFAEPRQWNPTEFYVGKKWAAVFTGTENGITWNTTHYMHIVRRELVKVPAGTFDTFRIEGEGRNYTLGIHGEMTRWLVPGLISFVKEEQVRRNRGGGLNRADRLELLTLRQHKFDP